MGQLRAIIIDEDRVRREKIRDILPEYIDSVAIGYGDGALDYIKPDATGTLPDIVILYGDDSKSLGLYTYDWMINKSGNADIAAIPVVVLTEDEFNDRCMEFLELGDVVFYEGEIDESRLFSVITEAIEAAEFAPEPVVAVYEETKSIDRLAGCSVTIPEGDGPQRAVVMDTDTKMKNLEAALERGKMRAAQIRTVLDAAKDAKSSKRDPYDDFIREKKKKPPFNLKRNEPKPDSIAPSFESIQKLKEKAMSNPFGAYNAQGSIKLDEPTRKKSSSDAYEKKTIVIVDGDIKTRKLCVLFLTQNFHVISFDSGIKTVDFFVKNRADLLIINPVLTGMSGISTVNSVHMQPGCANIPVMYIVGDDFMQSRASLLTTNVVGILNKPIKRETIAQAVEGLFGSNADD